MAKRLTPKQRLAERDEYREKLRKLLPPGSLVTAIKRHNSPGSGACRVDFYHFAVANGKVERYWLSYMVAKATGQRFMDKTEDVWLPFMNMDPAFSVVSHLSSVLGYGDKDDRLRSDWL